MITPSQVTTALEKKYSIVTEQINNDPILLELYKQWDSLNKNLLEICTARVLIHGTYSNRRLTKEILANVKAKSNEFFDFNNYLGYTCDKVVKILSATSQEIRKQIAKVDLNNPKAVLLFKSCEDLKGRLNVVLKQRGRLVVFGGDTNRVIFLCTNLFGYEEWCNLSAASRNLKYNLLFKDLLLQLVCKENFNELMLEKYFIILTDGDFEELSSMEEELYTSLYDAIVKSSEYRQLLVNDWYNKYSMQIIEMSEIDNLHKALFNEYTNNCENHFNGSEVTTQLNQITGLINK